ncbi:hypothetical protein [Muriicola sp. Z0-33]|uniref:hypothetical protein n=1 Tax=Muriicola sp. Z0-33 TaxID=2816957 RepID=UPI0022384D47|nr:hypothetical protein [Muriicola sp. Z0-33]MCW5515856.1 hypothetical protein [Muriicola sp. Z0-33]
MNKKHIFLVFIFLISFSLSAQDRNEEKHLFIRVYDPQGVKFNQGNLITIRENSILLKRQKKTFSIEVSEIGKIKTKRALGHNIGMGALGGASIGIIYGFAQGAEGGAFGTNSGGDNAVIFGTLGLMVGPIVGGLTGIGKKSRSFEINKDPNQLRKFKELVSQ